ncbi:MAG: hypothetical protein DRJ42_11400 [Deltaproteobacteria bacterium]|nr:MAG: hypothetical protein DRJ42_11400 [Deltaproteobacteria bacterium]
MACLAGLLLGALFCLGCGDDGVATGVTGATETQEATTGEAPTETAAAVMPAPDPNDPIGVEMARRAVQFAANTEVSTPIFRGSLETGRFQDYQAVLRSDRCFKIIGVGGAGVVDLDLFLFDPQGTQLQEDTATDAYPVLGLNHPICPDLRGDYRVRVRMFEGSGEFGVQIFHSPSF